MCSGDDRQTSQKPLVKTQLDTRSQHQGLEADYHRPWWHSPLIGYPLALPFVGCAFLIPWLLKVLLIPDHFIVPPFVIATFFVGLMWGIGPALFALILEVLGVDYLITPPLWQFTFFQWPDIVSFSLFVILQLLILCLIAVQKKTRQRLLLAQEKASRWTEKVTERNQLLAQSNAQLEQAAQRREQFLSRVAHELKTPLTIMRLRAQMALRRLSRQQPPRTDDSVFRADLEKVEAQTDYLRALVEDLLSLGSLRSAKMPLRIAACDLGRLCREVSEGQALLTNRRVDLRLPPTPLIVQADEGRLSQVVTNLVSNAIKYSPEDTVVQVDVYPDATRAFLSVHNDGSFLSQEQQKAIFEPFYRTPEAEQSATQGWGLGLAISKEIVEQHHGQLWVESWEGKGTTLFVALPR